MTAYSWPDSVYALVAVLASVITLGYLLSLQRKVFFGKLGENMQQVREASFGLILPALMLAVIIVGVGLIFPFIIHVFLIPIGG